MSSSVLDIFCSIGERGGTGKSFLSSIMCVSSRTPQLKKKTRILPRTMPFNALNL